ncbi:phage major capsid protein [Saccharopolyspora hattusasensis]|uniref:phage major capsid protein n=1 Tax=Saccharopolyspora hattusasensis TaxID=1128679 RepID=UPI003D97BAAC
MTAPNTNPLLTTTPPTGPALTPPDRAALVLLPLERTSLALRTATVIKTGRSRVSVPRLSEDVPSVWTAEGEEMTRGDPTVDELVLTPAKVAGLTVLSRELATDSDPAAAEMTGESLARSLRRTLDTAYLTDPGTGIPSVGVLTTPGIQTWAMTALSNLDVISDAVNAILAADGTPDVITLSPAMWGRVWKVKASTDSAVPVLGSPAGASVQPGTTTPPGQSATGAALPTL